MAKALKIPNNGFMVSNKSGFEFDIKSLKDKYLYIEIGKIYLPKEFKGKKNVRVKVEAVE